MLKKERLIFAFTQCKPADAREFLKVFPFKNRNRPGYSLRRLFVGFAIAALIAV